MNFRTLGKNGFNVSEIGLGCWQLGSDWGEGIDKESAFQILQEAVDQGITLFDTADVYGNGKSETFIGEFLKGKNLPIKVATKFGRGSNVYPDKYSKQRLTDSVKLSCERLGQDSLDLVQLHCIPKEELEKGEIFDWLRELKSEGLIKSFGASVETIEEGLICLKQEGIQSLQVIFNIFRQKLVKDLLPEAKKQNVGIIVRLPLASGLLSGKFSADTTFAAGDHRNYNKNGEAFNVGETFAGLKFEKGVELANYVKSNFLPEGYSMVDLTLRWILDHEAVTTIIPGASSGNQVIGNAKVSNMDSLPNDVHAKLTQFYFEEVHEHVRGAY